MIQKRAAKATEEFFGPNIGMFLKSSPDLNPIEPAFHLLKTTLKAESPQNKQGLKRTTVQALLSITREDAQRLVMSMGCRLNGLQRICNQIFNMMTLFHFVLIFSNYFWSPKNTKMGYNNMDVKTLKLKLKVCTLSTQ